MNSPYIDMTEMPVILVRFGADVHAAELADILGKFDKFYSYNTKRYALILDCSAARPAKTGARKLLVEHETRWKPYKKVMCAGTAFVVTDPMIRGLVQAVFWMQPAGYPLKVFGTREEARAWVKTCFAADGSQSVGDAGKTKSG